MQALNRCWLGAPLPTDLKQKVADAQTQIKKKAGSDAIRWLPAGELALTLVSVGEVSPSTITKIQVVASQVVTRHAPISLRLEGAGGSPNIVMPKFAWIGIEGDKERLIALQKDLSLCCKPLCSAIDDKPYEPVIEIGLLKRFDEQARTAMGRAIKMSAVGLLGEFTLGSIHLLHATTSASGVSFASAFELPLSN